MHGLPFTWVIKELQIITHNTNMHASASAHTHTHTLLMHTNALTLAWLPWKKARLLWEVKGKLTGQWEMRWEEEGFTSKVHSKAAARGQVEISPGAN